MSTGRRDGKVRVDWTLVIPLKELVRAKTRLSAATGERMRPDLALCFALDTLAAVLSCEAVADALVVTSDETAGRHLSAAGARLLPDPGQGLNAALEAGCRAARTHSPHSPVAALNADLPALRPEELGRALAEAADRPRAFVADTAREGTTMLTALPGISLRPAFGECSRKRHLESGAYEISLTGIDSLRRDVDTGEDLRAALALGAGPSTLRALGDRRFPAARMLRAPELEAEAGTGGRPAGADSSFPRQAPVDRPGRVAAGAPEGPCSGDRGGRATRT